MQFVQAWRHLNIKMSLPVENNYDTNYFMHNLALLNILYLNIWIGITISWHHFEMK